MEPIPGENDKMADTATRDALQAKRDELVRQFESATLEWIHASADDHERRKLLAATRDEVAAKLRENYWELDPYIRARSLYDRTGIILPGGKVNYYPVATAPQEADPEKTAPPPAVQNEAMQTAEAGA